MTKKIKFQTTDASFFFNLPKPAGRVMPMWYKDLSRVDEGTLTVKNCMPFLDAMTSGYLITLAADVYYKNGVFQEIAKFKVIDMHLSKQLGEFEIPEEYDQQPYKWINYFLIQTPKGYSSLITHPLNRVDLPFYTLSGIVETDTFPAPINFPFFVKKDFEGIIKEGTPIAQVFPFKRSDWKSDVRDDETYKVPVSFTNNVFNPPFGFYKKKFWKRKKYQ